MLPSTYKVREQKREENIDNILSSASAQDQVNSSFSPHNSHSALCHQLIPRTTGWENFFLREISKLKSLSESQREKLEAIAKKCAENEASGRLCRYCGRPAHKITELSYYCRQCGDCLSLDWHGGAK